MHEPNDVKEAGWSYILPFTIKSYDEKAPRRGWARWLDILCADLCDYATKLDVSETQNFIKHSILDRTRNFAISIGLLARSVYEVFEIGDHNCGEPRFVGCKISQNKGENPAEHPYADWSIKNLPFIGKSNDLTYDVRCMGRVYYNSNKPVPLFLHQENSQGTAAKAEGYCNLSQMKRALMILKSDRFISSINCNVPAIKLLDSLIIVCNKQAH